MHNLRLSYMRLAWFSSVIIIYHVYHVMWWNWIGPNTGLWIKIYAVGYSFSKHWTNTEYQIVLFGLNYLNTKYLELNSRTLKKFIFKFIVQMRWENSILYFHALTKLHTLYFILWQLFWVFEYSSKITNGPNTKY